MNRFYNLQNRKKMLLALVTILFSFLCINCIPAIDLYREEIVFLPNGISSDDMHFNDSVSAEEYYLASGVILDTIDVKESKTIQTEKEIVEFLSSRGFTQFPITEDYNMDGELSGNIIENETQSACPSYSTSYITSTGDIWTINVINGSITAFPETYNFYSIVGVPTIISEKTSIMSYDSITNTFFETIPNSDVLIVKIVNLIDAQTLERLTTEAIDAL